MSGEKYKSDDQYRTELENERKESEEFNSKANKLIKKWWMTIHKENKDCCITPDMNQAIYRFVHGSIDYPTLVQLKKLEKKIKKIHDEDSNLRNAIYKKEKDWEDIIRKR